MTDASRHTPDGPDFAESPVPQHAPGAAALAAAYLRGPFAPKPRTLVDIFRETVAECPDVPAIDNGATSQIGRAHV